MLVNQGIAISTSRVLLVPYESWHVERYHEWMQDEGLREATASEALSLAAEHQMQTSWRTDGDKLTFIMCRPAVAADDTDTGITAVRARDQDAPERMIGDVNMFLGMWEGDEERGAVTLQGELELMVAEQCWRGKGYGRPALLAFLHYVARHQGEIGEEFRAWTERARRAGGRVEEKQLPPDEEVPLRLVVKIQEGNAASIRLFESVGFEPTGPVNFFGESEFVWRGGRALDVEGTAELLRRYEVEGFREVEYRSCRGGWMRG